MNTITKPQNFWTCVEYFKRCFQHRGYRIKKKNWMYNKELFFEVFWYALDSAKRKKKVFSSEQSEQNDSNISFLDFSIEAFTNQKKIAVVLCPSVKKADLKSILLRFTTDHNEAENEEHKAHNEQEEEEEEEQDGKETHYPLLDHIIVCSHNVTSYSLQVLQSTFARVEIFKPEICYIQAYNHKAQPSIEKVPAEEVYKIIGNPDESKLQMCRILSTDPIVKWNGWVPGTFVKILRHTYDGVCEEYRMVTQALQ